MSNARVRQWVEQPSRHVVDGTLRVFMSEALMLPTGLLTVVFLTRKLGPEGFGLFTLSAAIVVWIEIAISSLFSKAAIKFLSEASDWREVGTTVLRLYLAVSCLAALLLIALSGLVSTLLKEPVLGTYFRLFALDIPLCSMVYAHQNILTGVGRFRQRAWTSTGRWASRLVLIVLFVQLKFSVPGAILGSIGASLVGLVIGRMQIRPRLFQTSPFPAKRLLGYALPLSLFALSMHLYSKLDLLMLKILGGTTDQVGIYGAAQNLSIAPGILALSFSPLLLSTVSRLLEAGEKDAARELGRNALRGVIWLLPFGAMTAGSATEIVEFIFGPQYLPGAPSLALLIFAALACFMISVATAILTANGKPVWPFTLTVPMVPGALVGHLLLIPRLGSVGAALSTSAFAVTGAITTVLAVYRLWRVLPPPVTLARSIAISVAAFLIGSFWPAPGLVLFLKIAAIGLFIIVAFLLSGELNASEIAFIRGFLSPRKMGGKSLDVIE